ncbi:MAG TPA: tetratricopeptide repeat protein [Pyrinomonadaceae bacterium]|nr:tetratricopeptide repeat protein [Pyrinomonadaceae bacterium]
MKSPAFKLLLPALALLACAQHAAPRPQTFSAAKAVAAAPRPDAGPARDRGWLRVRSENFHVVGHAPEAELRALVARLEEFRAVFRHVLGAGHFDSRTPTVFVVFSDREEYAPFKPRRADGLPDEAVAGYFQPNPQVNYITFAADDLRGDSLTAVAFHEYVHLLTRAGHGGRVPLWLAEGLSEYYNSYTLSDGGRRVRVGRAPKRRAANLREARELLPLSALLTVDHASPQYAEQEKRAAFYAQSWALVHYILSGPLRRGLAGYVEMVAAGEPPVESFERAFATNAAATEVSLRAYVRAGRYRERSEALGARPSFNPASTVEPLGQADVCATLGDLLMRSGRNEEAEAQLRAALAAEPEHAAARLALGILTLRDNRLEEAREHLTRAVAADPRGHLARYHLAELLLRSDAEADFTVAGFNEKTRRVRDELKRAIELAPGFPDAYALLAEVEIERGPDLEAAAALIRQGQRLAPARREFALLAARAQLRNGEFAAARAALNALLSERTLPPGLSFEARAVLDTLSVREEEAAAARAAGTLPAPPPLLQPCDVPEPGPQRKPLRFAGEQVCGRLVRIDCEDTSGGVVLTVSAGERTLRLRSDALNRIRFVTYTQSVTGRVECGPRAETVLVTYRPASGHDATPADGVVTAVEFLPDGWNR